MKICRIIGVLCMLSPFFTACIYEDKGADDKFNTINLVKDSSLGFIIGKFGIPYPDNAMPDSNSLIFYCSRTFDTTSLVHFQKRGSSVHGVFYEILPIYHRWANDYSDQGDSLLFFEGYSFSIDTVMWNSIREQAQIILQKGDSLYSTERYVDGNNYALYHNLQFSKGNSKYEEVYEKFDRFLKDAFLEKFLQARKPIMLKKAQ